MSYTSNLLLENPTPGDPAVRNQWGTIENTGRSLVDSAVSGIFSQSVAGSANFVLTSNQGSADQSRNQHFIFTGVLTGNIYVLWPNGLARFFSVTNNTTGAFTLSAAVTDGMGAPVGTSVSVAQGDTVMLFSNGTDVKVRAIGTSGAFVNLSVSGNATIGGTLGVTGAATIGSLTLGAALPIASGGTGQITATLAINALLPSQTGNSGKVLSSNGTVASWANLSTRELGEIISYGGSSAPSLWLLCFGQAISRSTYSALFAVIGTGFGVGNGTTTFNIPDLRGRAVFGKDDMGGSDAGRVTTSGSGIDGDTLGAVGGSEFLQGHTHTGTTASDGAHTHTQDAFTVLQTSGAGGAGAGGAKSTGGTTASNGAHTHTFTTASTGSGSSQNMVPAQIANYIIYAGA